MPDDLITVVGILSFAAIALFLLWVEAVVIRNQAKIKAKINTTKAKINTTVRFEEEWTRRLYLALQAVGLIALIIFDVNEDRRYDFFWDILGKWKYSGEENQLALAMLIAPYMVVKTIDWILAGRK